MYKINDLESSETMLALGLRVHAEVKAESL